MDEDLLREDQGANGRKKDWHAQGLNANEWFEP